MKILVVGSGGREHALCWAIRRERPDAAVFCAPGNGGTSQVATNIPIAATALDDLVAFAEREAIGLVVIGPEGPLAAGLADRLRERKIATFGPSAAAAQLEASKAFAKDVMASARVPTASSMAFSELAGAFKYIDAHAEPLVVKADGLAAGKGAVVCATRAEARAAAQSMLGDRVFGDAGNLIVVESFLPGEELSVLAVTNGTDVVVLPPAQDHKRLLEGDRGPNTGGMGAYSPVSFATAPLIQRIRDRVLEPTLAEMRRRGAPFSGVLYAGLMIDVGGNPWVIEFNCRFGDPETQVIVPRIERGLVDLLLASATGAPLPIPTIRPDGAVTTVLAARGYPDQPVAGDAITFPDHLPAGAVVFHAGTRVDPDGTVRTAGGRVLAVTGLAPTFAGAQATSRAAAETIQFTGKHFRRDIGWREAARP
ncbi:MAG: phosphoribosylamine--glycine ligase [Gemmatimonadales bacterium]